MPRVIFNVLNVGLGNNGGSHTLIQSANTLIKLGYETFFLTDSQCKYTWEEVFVPLLKYPNFNQDDIFIATGFRSVASTLVLPGRVKAHWIRGWETWNVPENRIFKEVLDNSLIKLANGICLWEKLKEYNIDSFIIRPGHNFEDFYPLGLRGKTEEIVLGGLYNKKHFKTKGIGLLLEIFSYFKRKFKVQCILMGNDDFEHPIIDKYFKQPTKEKKNEFYNLVDIWIAPTVLEGLHIPPQEAMLTEACVVGSNAQMSGMRDYLDTETGMIVENNFEGFKNAIEELINNPNKRKLLAQKGRHKILSLGSREENMKRMIELLYSNF